MSKRAEYRTFYRDPEYAREMGRKGGMAGRGDSKRRPVPPKPEPAEKPWKPTYGKIAP